ncbi:MAG: phosphate ABC transporter permease PstA [Dehalococcoidales bacterium]|jgi:phosphate transport system permease protein|nr:phosphate ABC transporter permease PstA [Dehalococcoidales bacterium]MDX9986071.1 phosphate ABC transporter permease PstA [Dehalococcoidales bacterium]
MKVSNVKSRYLTQRAAISVLAVSLALVVIPVIGIIIYMIANGYSSLSWEFLTASPAQAGKAGGIFPAILGTVYLMLGTILFALPVGVMAGIYLSEYTRANWVTRLINMAIINLAGVPSIVFGLFGLAVFVLGLNLGMSLLAASLTLAAQALAMTITTSREAIMAVPKEYREGSLAIGVSRWQTIRHVVLPQAFPGILTGAILAMSRAAGETAPIIVVGAAFLVGGLPGSPFDRFMALPYHLYTVSAHIPGMPGEIKWGVALVLIAMVLFFNILAGIVRIKARKR